MRLYIANRQRPIANPGLSHDQTVFFKFIAWPESRGRGRPPRANLAEQAEPHCLLRWEEHFDG